MKIRCIIIDDEPLAIKIIETYLKEFQNIELEGTFNNPLEAISTIEKGNIDVAFIDIKMPKLNGLEFIEISNSKTHFIITSAFREFAVESYYLNVLDYMVKPIPFNRFLKSINKLTKQIYLEKKLKGISSDEEKSFIFLKVDKKLIKIRFNEILYIESLKDYILIYTLTDKHLVHKPLTTITEELPFDRFLRIHRSFTIAIDKVEYLEGNTVYINGNRIPIGRKYIDHAKDIILNGSNDS
jgi:DNA-binding LytR/AlgR family response regulator